MATIKEINVSVYDLSEEKAKMTLMIRDLRLFFLGCKSWSAASAQAKQWGKQELFKEIRRTCQCLAYKETQLERLNIVRRNILAGRK